MPRIIIHSFTQLCPSISSSPFQHSIPLSSRTIPIKGINNNIHHTLKPQYTGTTSHTATPHHWHTHNNATPPANPPAGLRRNSNTHSHPRQPNNPPNQRRPQHPQRHPPSTRSRTRRAQRHPLGRRRRRQRGHGQEEQQSLLHLPQAARARRFGLGFFQLVER